MKKAIKYPPIIAVIFFLFLSCNTNSKQFDDFCFDFKTLSGQKVEKFIFPAKLSDSASYTLYIITRFSYRENDSILPLQITFKSPSGDTFSENIKLQTDYALIHNFVKNHPDDKRISMVKCSQYYDVTREYRTCVTPQEGGIWEILIELLEKPDKLLGIGISVKKIKPEGNEQKR